jgi:hypothetical protein
VQRDNVATLAFTLLHDLLRNTVLYVQGQTMSDADDHFDFQNDPTA